MDNRRIVSLIASSTEIVCALGLERLLVGISHECDYPPSIKHLPVCTGPKFPTDGTSYEIDQRVRAVLQESLSVYRVDAEMLDQLGPSHIITQSQCEVCAVSLKDVEEAACHLIHSKPAIVSLEPNSLDDIWADIKRVGKALGEESAAEELVSRTTQAMNAIAAKASTLKAKPTVACVEWIDPLMAGGNWMPELIQMAGGINLFGEAKKHSPAMTWEQFASQDPDVIFVSPCGFDIRKTLEEMRFLVSQPDWDRLSAVRKGNVYVADGNQYFNRPGPRVLESLEILAEILHPETFSFGHENQGWVAFERQSASEALA